MNRSQRIRLFSTGLAIAVFATSCNKPATAQNSSPSQGTTSKSQWSPLDGEAIGQAFEQVAAVWARRGDTTWYTINGTGGSDSLLPRSLVEAKDLACRAQREQLTEADKLNGVEWKGAVEFMASATRRKPLRPNAAWSDWESGLVLYGIGDGGSTYALEKRRGKWKIVKPAFDSLQLPSATDLP
jgi:hypothetical protein